MWRPFRPALQYARAVNVFAKLPPSQAVLRRARAAGVDTTKLDEIKAWRAAGEPKQWG